ncbi:MAG: glycosyltransferase [Candidatus Eremiobacteraeota bacterium]|nr:glycosyltransferase [Candidatus Eremiobacteraeota bacterium]MBV8435657.1 glycosyltransferase [Candidatus Eremiobacteraeota bacterium]MBV8720974.1 glycosyltransferase [Candidatus Eremiobacteraeota bacterium]
MTKRALFLISDTGGGHRSAANAITAALDEIESPFPFEHRIEDVAAHCAFPLTQLGLGYSMALRYAPPVYGALYYATNGRRRYKALIRFCEPLYRERLRDLFIGYQPDVIISVHPLLNHAALRARADAHMQHVPIVTVITDLGKVHESWLVAEADAVVVPAREVYSRALSRGVPPSRLRLLGHPIHPKFDDVTGSKEQLRAALGLPQNELVVMLMAGGEGGGKLLSTTMALARARLPIHMVVVCGRNEHMQQKLSETGASLPTPMTVLGFTDKIPEYFRAVDLLVTKAGPGTLAEANAAQLPVVVYDYVPGQERGNVDFVRNNGLGAVALHGAGEVVNAVRTLIRTPDRLETIRHHQETVAPRRSSRRIAALIAQLANTGTIPSQDDMPAGALRQAVSI